MAEAGRRLFLALWPDAALASQLETLAAEAGPTRGGRRMRRETLHLTLAFLGDVAEARLPELLAALEEIRRRPFALQLDTLGYWPHNGILWAGCSAPPAELALLAGDIREACAGLSLAAPDKPFFPHLTLLRKAQPAGPPAPLPPLAWPVHEWLLMESCPAQAGVDYRRLAGWRLA